MPRACRPMTAAFLDKEDRCAIIEKNARWRDGAMKKKLAAVLPGLCEGTPQQSADAVLAWVMEQNPHPPADDMSILVTYIWKKKHTY